MNPMSLEDRDYFHRDDLKPVLRVSRMMLGCILGGAGCWAYIVYQIISHHPLLK